MKQVIVRICDMGCIDNALPVAEKLLSNGVAVQVYRDPGSIALEKVVEGFDFVDTIPAGALVLSCLPLGVGYEQMLQQGNPIVLIQENPDPADKRFAAWSEVNVQITCTILKPSFRGNYSVTGLPSIDNVASAIKAIDRNETCQKIGVDPQAYIVSLALPGDEAGCMKMLEALGDTDDYVIVARSHPKLKKLDPEGYQRVSDRVDEVSIISLAKANEMLGPLESMALAVGSENYFVGTHDTTMNWQAAAAGVYNIQVLPPPEGADEWAKTAPIITSLYGRVLEGGLKPHMPNRSFITGSAVSDIATVVKGAM